MYAESQKKLSYEKKRVTRKRKTDRNRATSRLVLQAALPMLDAVRPVPVPTFKHTSNTTLAFTHCRACLGVSNQMPSSTAAESPWAGFKLAPHKSSSSHCDVCLHMCVCVKLVDYPHLHKHIHTLTIATQPRQQQSW